MPQSSLHRIRARRGPSPEDRSAAQLFRHGLEPLTVVRMVWVRGMVGVLSVLGVLLWLWWDEIS